MINEELEEATRLLKLMIQNFTEIKDWQLAEVNKFIKKCETVDPLRLEIKCCSDDCDELLVVIEKGRNIPNMKALCWDCYFDLVEKAKGNP